MATTTRRLVVEVVDARGLLPKDGHGASSPYVVADFYGQRRRTRTVHRDLNPAWNEALEFNVGVPSDVFGDTLELDVYHDRNVGPTRRNNFLGRLRLNSSQFVRKGEEALMYFPLEKKSFFSWIQGEIGLKIYYVNEIASGTNNASPPPPPPPPPPSEPAVAPADPPPEGDPPAETAAVEPLPPKVESEDMEKKQEIEAEKPDAATSDGQQNDPPPPASAVAESATTNETPVEAAAVAAEQEVSPPGPPPSENPNIVEEQPKESEVSPPTETPELAQPEVITNPAVPMELKSNPEVTVAGFADAGLRPLSRQTTSESFIGDPTDKIANERKSYDLVEKMYYLFVKVVKARSLPTNGTPVVKISVSNCHVRSKPARKTTWFEWDQTFAFGRESPDSMSTLEVSLWNPHASLSLEGSASSDVAGMTFLGGICFDATEIPIRDPPDSPLAPQWYRLEGGGAHNGDLMLATWVGTQADEAFPDSWKTDTVGSINSKSKVYLSPKMWYLRVTVIEAQDIIVPLLTTSKELNFQVRAQLGFQVLKSKPFVSRNGSLPLWNEDLIFVASEPFGNDDHLIMSLENRLPKGTGVLGVVRIPLTTIERRVDDRKVVSRWFSLEDSSDGAKKSYKGRIHLRLCFDGGYHVMDEAAHVSSDYRPTARQLWKPHVGTVELGIIGCKSLLPMRIINGNGTTDAYAVAKYGPKWVRTRTVSDSMDPRWNEQYTWRVYDPCTVLTLGVFDSSGVHECTETQSKEQQQKHDFRIGKIRVRISMLQAGRVYRNTYPLLLLCPTGVRHMGEIELAVRFIPAIPTVDLCHLYTQPILPPMHHIKPLGVVQQEMLRNTASKIVSAHLSRSEPPLPREVVLYMLDADSHAFSMRKIRANWHRIVNVMTWLVDVARWVEEKRTWKNPTATLLVHALLVMLVWFPDLILPTLSFYVFVIGAWNYRFRSKDLQPHLDSRISQAESTDRDELDEEFDTVPSSRSGEVVRARYDKLRAIGARVQCVLGDVAAQGERVQALVTWRDPRATGMFIGLCFLVAVVMYVVPSKMVAMAFGFYYMRHPMFRDRMPSPALSFFRRLPSLSDRIM